MVQTVVARWMVVGPARRFAMLELALWASLYPAYLAIRG